MITAAMTSQAPATQTYTLKKTLVLWQLVMIGLAYIQPMTVFDTFGIVGKESGNHVPTAYFIALLAMLFTALSYGHMVRKYPSAGSAYTYAQKSLTPSVGFLVGWASLLDYVFMPMINILLAKIYLATLFPGIPGWIFIVGLALMMTIINLKGIELVAHFNAVIVFFQLAVMAVFLWLVIKGIYFDAAGAGTLLSSDPFFTTDLKITGVVAGATILCFSFLGFDGLSSLSEETVDPAKNIPRAIFLTTLIGGVIFIITTYFLQLYFPRAELAIKDLDASQPELFLYVAGKGFQAFGLCFSIATVFASGMAAHAGVSRLMYVMGRDNIFPKRIFGFIHPTLRTPSFNVMFVGLIAISGISFSLEEALHLVNFGALTAFTFVNISVIAQFYIREGRRKTVKDTVKFLILPLIGALAIGLLWVNLEMASIERGLIWVALGVLYLACITKGFRKYPEAFRQGTMPALD